MNILTIFFIFIIFLSLFIFLTIIYKNEKKQIEYYNQNKQIEKNTEKKNISIIKIIIVLLIFYITIKYIFPIIEFNILYNLIFN